jgi:transposase-like protein
VHGKDDLGQHFLLSADARTLSLVDIARMSEDEARAAFRAMRFAGNKGKPYCPNPDCKRAPAYTLQCRPAFKCTCCQKRFTLTSGTLFANRKMCFRDILFGILLFVNGANGHSALRLSRDLKCSYKTAWVLLHKLRTVMGMLGAGRKLSGIVEVDGTWVGGYIKPANPFERKLPPEKRKYSEKRRSVVTIRERRRRGRTISFVANSEKQACMTILAHTEPTAILHTDMGSGWSLLLKFRRYQQVNHSKQHVRRRDRRAPVHCNGVEAFNGHLKAAQRGVHRRISGQYLQSYADEMGWRLDHRKIDNKRLFNMILKGAAEHAISPDWAGYWQRRGSDGPRPEFTRLLPVQARKAA